MAKHDLRGGKGKNGKTHEFTYIIRRAFVHSLQFHKGQLSRN